MTKTATILLVEDEKDIAQMFSLLLKENGFKVTIAENGLVALKKIKEEKPNLVLLDLVIPEIDGYQILREVKSDSALKNILIYVFSNLTQDKEIEGAKKLGADGYLIKSDYTPKKLVEKIKEILKIK